MGTLCGSKLHVLILVIFLYEPCYSGSIEDAPVEPNKPDTSLRWSLRDLKTDPNSLRSLLIEDPNFLRSLVIEDPNFLRSIVESLVVVEPIPQGTERTRLRTEEMTDPKAVRHLIDALKMDRLDGTPIPQGAESSKSFVVLPESRQLTEVLRDDEEIAKEYKAYVIALMEREKEKMEERRQVVRWTNRISCFIFVIVHGFIGFGFWAALREFRHANKTRAIIPDKQELQVSLQGIALKTSLHGTILLAISLVLYFLYLKFVYPIE